MCMQIYHKQYIKHTHTENESGKGQRTGSEVVWLYILNQEDRIITSELYWLTLPNLQTAELNQANGMTFSVLIIFLR